MRVADLHAAFDRLAPSGIAWKGDNIGLLVGHASDRITNILVALDLTKDVIAEARKRKANLIITHHPLPFQPMRSVTDSSRTGALVLALTEQRINLFAAHTNLDSVQWGVNGTLARTLGLQELTILSPLQERLTTVSVFVPETHVEAVAEAMHNAGGGTFSKYDHCSFRVDGTGTFRGMNDAKPFIGSIGTVERVKEVRLEMLVEQWKLRSVIAALRKAHPYEEVAYDIIPLQNGNTEFGLGMIGTLPKPMTQQAFLTMVKSKLRASALRFSGAVRSVRTVAVLGGSGSDHIRDAIAQGADAMVTADLKYHTFQEYEASLLLVDAGHYETECGVLPVLAEAVQNILNAARHRGKVFVTSHSTNPVQSLK